MIVSLTNTNDFDGLAERNFDSINQYVRQFSVDIRCSSPDQT